LIQKGKLEEGMAAYQKALEIDPNQAAVRANLGGAFFQKNDLEAAIRENLKAIELNPSFALAHNNLVHAYRAKGDLEAARLHCQKATELGFQVNPELAKELGCQEEG
jgi:tetratricopeptide (TPR) repeat protein